MVSSSILKRLTEAVSEERISEIAKEAANDIPFSDLPTEETKDESGTSVVQTLKISFLLPGGMNTRKKNTVEKRL